MKTFALNFLSKIAFILLFTLTSFSLAQAQITIQVGSGNTNTSFFPLYYLYNYTYTQSIYTSQELINGGMFSAGNITKIRYKPSNTVSTDDWKDWEIYLGNTTKSDYSSTTDWIPTSQLTEVFDGEVLYNVIADQWMEITLDTPFEWDGSSNLVVAIRQTTPTWGNNPGWYGYEASTSETRGIYFYNDTTFPDLTNPPTANYYSSNLAQIQFEWETTAFPCTGAPIIGVIGAPDSMCQVTPFHIIVEPIIATDIDIQWQTSPSGQNTWSIVPGADNFTQIFNGLNEDTDYRIIVTCMNSNLSDTSDIISIQMSDPMTCYCIPEYLYGCIYDDYISNVTMTGETVTLNFSTGCGLNGYNDYRAEDTVDFIEGNTYTISVSTLSYWPEDQDVKIWIDFNKNGIFEASEEVANTNGNGMPSSGTYTTNITIPMGITEGEHVLRIRLAFVSSNIDPCDIEFYGETEDYMVHITSYCEDPLVDLGPDIIICEGESITLDAGNPGLTYEWSNNATSQTIEVSSSGTYTVTVIDGNCSSTDTIVVSMQDLPMVDLGNDKKICDGETIILNAGNSSGNYLWNDQSTNQTLEIDTIGIYYVTVTEDICSNSDTVEVSYYDLPSADGIIIIEQGDCTYSMSINNPENVHSIEWDFGDGSIPTIGSLATHSYNENGSYTLSATLKNICEEELIITHEIICESVSIYPKNGQQNTIRLFPNPATDYITISSNPNIPIRSIIIYDIKGEKVYENTLLNTDNHIIHLNKFKSGIYTAAILTNQGYITLKIILIK